MLEINKIHNIDCLEGMKQMEDNSIDLIVTDPPFGIGFMGKAWDTFKPDYIKTKLEIQKKRTRNDGRNVPINQGVTTAGSYNRSKEGLNTYQQFMYKVGKSCLRVLKQGSFMFMCMTPRQDCQSRVIIALEDAGFNMGFTPLYWAYASGFPKASNIGKMVDKKFGVESEIIGTGQSGKILRANGQNERPYQEGKDRIDYKITTPSTPQAKALDGSYGGFQPKPAVEVIIVAMKPLSEKTYVEQALKNRKGITWLDDCRVPYESEGDKESARFGTQMDIRNNNYKTPIGVYGKNILSSQQGRFPANLLVSDDVLNDGKKHSAGDLTGQKGSVGNVYGIYNRDRELYWKGNPVDSFSRYFDLDKWHINKLPNNVKKTFPFLIVPKASSGEKNEGLDGFDYKSKRPSGVLYNEEEPDGFKDTLKHNIHPTVKPTKLMEYLITLGSRENDIILDPFMGSGTTAIASRLLSRRFVGFEYNKEYHNIAETRVKDHMEQTKLTEILC